MPNKTFPFSSEYLQSSLNKSENRKNPFAKNMTCHRNPPLNHDNTQPHTAAATVRLLKRFRWEVFDHPPSSARTWLPVIFISFLV